MFFIKHDGDLDIREIRIKFERGDYIYFDIQITYYNYIHKNSINEPCHHYDEDISFYYIICEDKDFGIKQLYSKMIKDAEYEANYWRETSEKLKEELSFAISAASFWRTN